MLWEEFCSQRAKNIIKSLTIPLLFNGFYQDIIHTVHLSIKLMWVFWYVYRVIQLFPFIFNTFFDGISFSIIDAFFDFPSQHSQSSNKSQVIANQMIKVKTIELAGRFAVSPEGWVLMSSRWSHMQGSLGQNCGSCECRTWGREEGLPQDSCERSLAMPQHVHRGSTIGGQG